MKRKLIRLAAILTGTLILLTGCSTSVESNAPAGTAPESSAVAGTTAASTSDAAQTGALDLNGLSLDDIISNAKTEGEVNSAGMPDSWANWGETWKEITEEYGIKHADVDMSSAEELAMFEAEKNNATKDIGDVGQAFGPTAVEQGLALAYKTTYWESIPDWAKDDKGNWVIAYYGTISMIVNKDLVEKVPTSFDDILNGKYKISVGDVTKAAQAQCAVLAAAIAYGGSETNIQPGIDYFQKIAKQGRLDLGELNMTRLEKGEIAVAFLWDYNALGYRDQIKTNNANVNVEVNIPSEASIQSGYCTVINAYAKHPNAAALAREYILSDEGQINLAKGYAKPVRDVALPADVSAKLISNDQYKNARMIKDQAGWKNTVSTLGTKWQEEVIAYAS